MALSQTQDVESPNQLGAVSRHFYHEDKKQPDDDFEMAGFRAELVSPSESSDDVSYADVQQLFHIDPSNPIWEIPTENSSLDEDEINQYVSHLDEHSCASNLDSTS